MQNAHVPSDGEDAVAAPQRKSSSVSRTKPNIGGVKSIITIINMHAAKDRMQGCGGELMR